MLRPQIIEVIVDQVQNVLLSRFQTLRTNDLLFVDSSPVGKTGSLLNCRMAKAMSRQEPVEAARDVASLWLRVRP